MQYYDRRTKSVVDEIEYQKDILNFLYKKKLGRILLKVFVARPWFSKLMGLYRKSRLSKKNIIPFIEKYKVKVSRKELTSFKTFNDFFIREKRKPKNKDKNDLVAIADGKLSVYNIDDDLRLNIKQSSYSIDEIVENKKIADMFRGGTCLVYRLAVSDNHRYNFIDDGKTAFVKKIKGMLHTIRPISAEYNVYSRNSRVVTLLNTRHLGYVCYVEVGALLVGKIHNHKKVSFKKNDEKGYFEFGGSTIVVLLNKDIIIDDDIVKMNANDLEVQVYAGERIGSIC